MTSTEYKARLEFLNHVIRNAQVSQEYAIRKNDIDQFHKIRTKVLACLNFLQAEIGHETSAERLSDVAEKYMRGMLNGKNI